MGTTTTTSGTSTTGSNYSSSTSYTSSNNYSGSSTGSSYSSTSSYSSGGSKTCPRCEGHGYLDNMGGGCKRTDAYMKGKCPLCYTSGKVRGNYKPCMNCNTKG